MPRTHKMRAGTRKRRPTATRNKKYIKNRRSSYHQQKQLLSLQRQVQFQHSKLRDRAQYAQFFVPLDEPDEGTNGSQVTLPNGTFYVTDLVKPSQFASIFQSTSTVTLTNKFQFSSYDIQMLFSPKNSETALTPRIVRVWVLGLRPETGARTLNETNQMTSAGLNQSPINEYYRAVTSDGGLNTLVKFNPAAFKIYAYREFLMGNILNEESQEPIEDNATSANLSDPIKRARIMFRMRNKLKPPTESWRTMSPNQLMPNDRRFLCINVGGWGGVGVDGDNAVVMNANIICNGRLTN